MQWCYGSAIHSLNSTGISSANIFYIQERIGTIQALKDAARKSTIHIRR